MKTTHILVIVCTTGQTRRKRPRTSKAPPAKKLPQQLLLPFIEFSSAENSIPDKIQP
jgi:hypothetical protein